MFIALTLESGTVVLDSTQKSSTWKKTKQIEISNARICQAALATLRMSSHQVRVILKGRHTKPCNISVEIHHVYHNHY